MSVGSELSQVRRRIGLTLSEDSRWIGGSIYLQNLVHALASLCPRDRPELTLLCSVTPESKLVRHLSSFDFVSGTLPHPIPFRTLPRLIDRVRRRLAHPRPAEVDIDLEFPVFDVGQRVWPALYWIPDFQHKAMPHLFSRQELSWRDTSYSRIARQHGVLLLSSQAALSDFRRWFPDAVVRPRVWSFCSSLGAAADGGANPHTQYGLPEKFLYVANQFWAHKDHATVFRALAMLKARGITPTIVCTGLEDDYRNPDFFKGLMKDAAGLGVAAQIRSLGLVPREDQVEIFRHAAAVVQPSLFEGWSTVVEDAKTLGRPLILSDIAPHLEQATGNDRFFRAGSAEDLTQVLETLWPKLAPGPDPSAERAALEDTARRRPELARAFMAIAEEAITLGGHR